MIPPDLLAKPAGRAAVKGAKRPTPKGLTAASAVLQSSGSERSQPDAAVSLQRLCSL